MDDGTYVRDRMGAELAVGSGAVNISEPREDLLFDCVVEPSPKDSE